MGVRFPPGGPSNIKPTIRYANAGSYHLWCTFGAADVVSMHWLGGLGQGVLAIRFMLAPSPGRAWNCVQFIDAYRRAEYDSMLFLSLARQIITVYPDMKVQGLYPSYHGGLPR
jgi:hypothetical protein